MKSLKHYFTSPSSGAKEAKEPLQSTQNINNDPRAKGDGDTKKKKETKPKKPAETTTADKQHLDKELEVEKSATKHDEVSPSSNPKSNAFQLIMSQKKRLTPEEPNKKKTAKSDTEADVPLQESRKATKKKEKVENGDEKVAQPRKPRMAKTKAKKSWLPDSDESSWDDLEAPQKKKQPNKSIKGMAEKKEKESEKKEVDSDTEEIVLSARIKKRKRVASNAEEEPDLPQKTQPEKNAKEGTESCEEELFKKCEEQKKPTKRNDAALVQENPKTANSNGSEKGKKSKKLKVTSRTKPKSAEIGDAVATKVISLKENQTEPSQTQDELNRLPDQMETDDPGVFKNSSPAEDHPVRKKRKQDEGTTPVTPKSTEFSKVQKKSIASFFTPISRDEALKRAATVLEGAKMQTIKADVHPEPLEEQRRRSMGPSGRLSSSRSPRDADSIEVLEAVTFEEPEQPPVQREEQTSKKPRKSPQKAMKRKKKLWALRVRLLSPAKSISELSNMGDDSDSSTSDSDLEILSPSKIQINRGWGAGGKLAPIFLSKDKNLPKATPLAAATRKIFSPAPLPQIRAAPTEHTIGFADEDPETPISALVPSVGHVGFCRSDQSQDGQTQRLLELMNGAQDDAPKAPKPFDLGEIAPTEKIEKMKRLPERKPDCESWCDKYKPKLADAVAGNEHIVNRLRAWLETWTDNKTGTSRSADQSDVSEDSMDDFIVSDDDDSSQGRKKKKKRKSTNTVLLIGPSGSGKTASVYAIAEELGFKVLEVNASSKRSGKRILAELREATQSHQVRNSVVDQDSINTFFGKAKSSKSTEWQSQANTQSLSLILVEDVDIIFEDQDEGFVGALNSLAENSKRPLILISNDPNCSLVLSRQHRIHFQYEKVPVAKSVDIIEDICHLEDRNVDREVLKKLVVQNRGDLRSTLLSTQFLTISGEYLSSSVSRLGFPVNLDEILLRLQAQPLPFIIKESEVTEEDDTRLNTTWGDDSDSETLFKDLPLKSKIVNKIRSKLLPPPELEVQEEGKVERISACTKDLEDLSKLTDSIASLDVLRGTRDCPLRNNMLPGLSDQLDNCQPPDLVGPKIQYELAERILSLFKVENLGIDQWESNQSWIRSHSSVDRGLVELLPICDQLDRQAVACDYMPVLRELGRCEQNSSRASRRSVLNCLHSLGMQPDQFVLQALPFVFK